MGATNENIGNAFKVIHLTYESVKKMMALCDSLAENHGMVSNNRRFLRYKSDDHVIGWYTQGFVKTYIRDPKSAEPNRIIYAVNINFYNDPTIYVSVNVYDNDIPSNISPDKYWMFDNPVGEERSDEFEDIKNSSGDVYHVITKKEYIDKYKGLKHIYYMKFNIDMVNRDNLKDVIFGSFSILEKLVG